MVSLLLKWESENSGVFQLTAPALALTNFRHTYHKKGNSNDSIDIVCNPNGREHILERRAYFGGRTNCYFVGLARGNVYHLDVNSLYPYCMRNFSFPRRFVRFQEGMSHDELQSAMRVYGVVASVLIKSRHSTFPVRIDGKQYHSTGEYWTALCGPELQRAFDTESISRVGTVQLYSIAPLFAEWVDYWYDRKLKAIRRGHDGLAELEFVKLILCSLSGKFAQRGRVWVDRPDIIPMFRWGGWVEHDVTTGRYEKWRGIGGHAQILSEESEPDHAFPAISAFITSHGREYMRRIVSSCPERSVYYMATDSIICDHRAFDYLQRAGFVDQFAIGKFKILGQYTECEIFGPNHYTLDDQTTASGHMGKLLSRENPNGRIDLRESLPSIIANGPRSDTILTSVPVDHMRPDFRGHINPEGWWEPFRLTLDPDFSDRPPSVPLPLGYLLDKREGRIPVDA